MLHIKVLGSGAGGGFPQWNCSCDNCSGLRAGTINAKARTQSSIAISNDKKQWIIINTSPDIRHQLWTNPEFHPAQGKRDTPIKAVVLVDAQIDHTTGLLILREGQRLPVYCTSTVYQDLTTGYPILNLLDKYCKIDHHPLPIEDHQTFQIPPFDSLTLMALPLVGKAPPYSPYRNDPRRGDNIGLLITDNDSGKSLFYAPALEAIPEQLLPILDKADCLMVDGTFWTEDEMITQGVGSKLASQMGHMPLSGDNGIIHLLNRFENARKILIHINNTNPILNESSEQHQQLKQQGIEVAFDGMDITLQ